MTIPTAQEQLLLNEPDHQTDLYLSIFKPSTALACQVNGSYDSANQTVDYDNVTAGNYLNVESYRFMVALIGTTAGDDDRGRTYVRSATSSQIRFVESNHINWTDDLFITILKFTEIIPVFPRIIQNPSNDEDVIFYKMWDIAYTNQNSVLGTFIKMGCNYAGFRDPASGLCPVYFTASGTSNVVSSALTYSWSFEGALVTGSTAHTPGYINWNTPGHYRVILTTTAANGRVDSSVRYVSVYDRPGAGSNTPFLRWEFTDPPSVAWDTSGYKFSVRVRDNVPESSVIDGALVVIFGEDYYGSTKQSIGGNSMNRQTIKFVGYIIGGTIQHNYQDKYVDFDVLSPGTLMEITECYSVSCESKQAPATWFQIKNMTISRAIYHYLAWHSTVLQCCDFDFNMDDRNVQFFDSDRESLFDAINTFVNGTRFASLTSDKQGNLYVEQDPAVIQNASSALGTTLSITSKDWLEMPNIEEREMAETSFIEMGGIAWFPATKTFSAHLASSPSLSSAYRGSVERIQGLALTGQSELNQMIGNILAFHNSRYPNSDYSLKGNYGNIDIVPQEKILSTIQLGDIPRSDVAFTNKAFCIRRVQWVYDPNRKILYPQLSLAEITQGFAGTTITIPDVPPATPKPSGAGGTFNVPPITTPPIPQATPAPTVTGGIDDILWVQTTKSQLPCPLGETDFYQEYIDTGGMWSPSNRPNVYKNGGLYVVHYSATLRAKAAGAPPEQNVQFGVDLRICDSGDVVIESNVVYNTVYESPTLGDSTNVSASNTILVGDILSETAVHHLKLYIEIDNCDATDDYVYDAQIVMYRISTESYEW